MDSEVYARLASVKRDGESFSKAISRLLDTASERHTGQQILRDLADLPSLAPQDEAVMRAVVAENREREPWDEHDLR